MTDQEANKQVARYSTVAIVTGYLVVQAFLLWLTRILPWPVVGVESWGGHHFESVIPGPVWLYPSVCWARVLVDITAADEQNRK